MIHRLFKSFMMLCLTGTSVAYGQDSDRDPTVPTPELLEKLAPPPEVGPSEPTVKPPPTRASRPTAKTLPQMKLSSIVISPAKTGNAVVEIGDRRARIELTPALHRAAITVPPSQGDSQSRSKPDGGPKKPPTGSLPAPASELSATMKARRQVLVNSSLIQVDGMLWQLISFDDAALVFRQLSNGRIIIAR